MNSPNSSSSNSEIPARLDALLAQLCDESPTQETIDEIERLAGVSASARRYVLNYLELHGELLWSNGRLGLSGFSDSTIGHSPEVVPPFERPPTTTGHRRRTFQRLRSLTAVLLVSAASIVIVGLFFARLFSPSVSEPTQVATLVDQYEAQWAVQGATQDAVKENNTQEVRFFQNNTFLLQKGYARFRLKRGADVILQAPAKIQFSGENRVDLDSGRLTARVPQGAIGFEVRTHNASIVDLGTEFGVSVLDADACEVRVFSGEVEVAETSRVDSADSKAASARRLGEGDAFKITGRKGGLSFSRLLKRGLRYVRRLPPPAPFPFQKAVENHPALLHHYTFEGFNRTERLEDRHGMLHLLETVMLGGRGNGSLAYSDEGFRGKTSAVTVRRSRTNPNTQGTALQTERVFSPPPKMTVELLLRFDRFSSPAEGAVAAAIATRADESDCGFLVTVVEDGQLAHLFDADAPWVESGFVLKPNVWYYVASTFQVQNNNQTRINTYVADLSEQAPQLRHVVKDQTAPGVPAVGRLGIGKAFDETTAHAYPWSGAIDEVCIYNDVLDELQLREHLELLFRGE